MYREATTLGLTPTLSERDASREEWVVDHWTLADQFTITTASCPEHGETAECWPAVPMSTLDFCGACLSEAERPFHVPDRSPHEQRELDFNRLHPDEAGRGLA